MKRLIPVLSLIFFLACTKTERVEVIKEFDTPAIEKAIAVINPVGNSKVSGTVSFMKTENGSTISAQIKGLSKGKHGFHIHQFGDCSATDGTSAGGHFNPDNNEHDAPEDATKHVGDMGNLVSEGEEFTTNLTLNSTSIFIEQVIGRGIIIHAGEDDLMSQPSGDAGARIACGVIGISE
jgi:Cu-Zn family superoxide dismutase